MAESRHGRAGVLPPAFLSLLGSTLKAHGVASRRAARSLSISPYGLVTLLMPMEGWMDPPPSHPPIFRRPTLFLVPFLFLANTAFRVGLRRPAQRDISATLLLEQKSRNIGNREKVRQGESAEKGESLGSHFSRPPHDCTSPKELHFLSNSLNLSSLFPCHFFFHFCIDLLLLSCSFPFAFSRLDFCK